MWSMAANKRCDPRRDPASSAPWHERHPQTGVSATVLAGALLHSAFLLTLSELFHVSGGWPLQAPFHKLLSELPSIWFWLTGDANGSLEDRQEGSNWLFFFFVPLCLEMLLWQWMLLFIISSSLWTSLPFVQLLSFDSNLWDLVITPLPFVSPI